jgi:hypothetical protein
VLGYGRLYFVTAVMLGYGWVTLCVKNELVFQLFFLPKKCYKFVTKPLQNCSVSKAILKRYRFVSDPFDIRYG